MQLAGLLAIVAALAATRVEAQIGQHSPGVKTNVTCHRVGLGASQYRYTLRNLRDENNGLCALQAFENHCPSPRSETMSCDHMEGGRCGINSIGPCNLFEDLYLTCPQMTMEEPCRYYPNQEEMLASLDEIQAALNKTRAPLGKTTPALNETSKSLNEAQALLNKTQASFDRMQASLEEMEAIVNGTQVSLEELGASLNETQASTNKTLASVNETNVSS